MAAHPSSWSRSPHRATESHPSNSCMPSLSKEVADWIRAVKTKLDQIERGKVYSIGQREKIKDTGDDVKVIQLALKLFLEDYLSKLPTTSSPLKNIASFLRTFESDGLYGGKSDRATTMMQHFYNELHPDQAILVTGRVGKEVYGILNKEKFIERAVQSLATTQQNSLTKPTDYDSIAQKLTVLLPQVPLASRVGSIPPSPDKAQEVIDLLFMVTPANMPQLREAYNNLPFNKCLKRTLDPALKAAFRNLPDRAHLRVELDHLLQSDDGLEINDKPWLDEAVRKIADAIGVEDQPIRSNEILAIVERAKDLQLLPRLQVATYSPGSDKKTGVPIITFIRTATNTEDPDIIKALKLLEDKA